ncbi:MAG TPA: hypothetical protein VNH83_26570 [Bryobacteraceae bacterium]|jgi:hypothetical protein|nr:hypothetical protein [Bryobacteraceae bacterium]
MATERPRDLYPLMTLEYVVDALKVLFGRENVVSDKDEITVRVQYPGNNKLNPVNLTIEQAKFVVARAISAKDLIEENYPADWPGGARRIPRPSHRGAEPLLFKDGNQ